MYEQLLSRKAKPSDHLIRWLVIVLIAVFFLSGIAFFGYFAILLSIALLLAAKLFIFPMLKVEYEYILLNHDMQIDIIYNKSRRKTLLEFDILKAESIAPKGFDLRKAEKVYDCTSGRNVETVYAVMVPVNHHNACILIEPDATMKAHLQTWTGPHTHL